MSSTRGHLPGKLRFDRLPPHSLIEVARAATIGEAKHHDRPSVERPVAEQIAALQRHLYAFLAGQDDDPEGFKHLASVGLRSMQVMETLRRIEAGELAAELDDRPHRRRERCAPPHDCGECPTRRRENGSDDVPTEGG